MIKALLTIDDVSSVNTPAIVDYLCGKNIKVIMFMVGQWAENHPDELIYAPLYNTINVHASLLPKYRGGAPIHHAIINGDKETGVTVMYMDKKMDAGDIISQREIEIDDNITLDGDIASSNTPVLPNWIVILAVSSAVLILLIMSDNLIEPFLILYSVGIAVFLNKGSNILFDSVSNVTDGIVAVLQMALSMDYSIILINRFKQEKKHFNTNKEAMKEALHKSITAISSSSLTTIVGLLVLVFMMSLLIG